MDILFNCQACGQNLVIDECGAGLVIQCPKCRQDLIVPAPKGVDQPPGPKPAIDTQKIKKTTVAIQWVPPSNPDDQSGKPPRHA